MRHLAKALLSSVMITAPVLAGAPPVPVYSGTLSDGSGLYSGELPVRLRLYDYVVEYKCEIVQVITVSGGMFEIPLLPDCKIPLEAGVVISAVLEIDPDGAGFQAFPAQPIDTAPYAFLTQNLSGGFVDAVTISSVGDVVIGGSAAEQVGGKRYLSLTAQEAEAALLLESRDATDPALRTNLLLNVSETTASIQSFNPSGPHALALNGNGGQVMIGTTDTSYNSQFTIRTEAAPQRTALTLSSPDSQVGMSFRVRLDEGNPNHEAASIFTSSGVLYITNATGPGIRFLGNSLDVAGGSEANNNVNMSLTLSDNGQSPIGTLHAHRSPTGTNSIYLEGAHNVGLVTGTKGLNVSSTNGITMDMGNGSQWRYFEATTISGMNCETACKTPLPDAGFAAQEWASCVSARHIGGALIGCSYEDPAEFGFKCLCVEHNN